MKLVLKDNNLPKYCDQGLSYVYHIAGDAWNLQEVIFA